VVVRALIAHTNTGGEKKLRKLELRLLECGATVARTADDLTRYHGKMMVVDGAYLHLYGFNFTTLDIDKSRSFGIVTRDRKLVAEAMKLFEADAMRQNYAPSHRQLVVSPENSRALLTNFIKGARKQLLIYDAQVSDNQIQRVLQERSKAGVEIRIIGSLEKSLKDVKVRALGALRLHVRAIVRDGREAFVGSQSLRRLELEGRREVGIIIRNAGVVRKIVAMFETDWAKNSRKRVAA
jgi:phosphatidylserine/phosphatidylglycerophosphate/cardiolipin synthase-like enzyme